MRHFVRDHRLLIVLPLLLVMLVIVPALTMGLTWVRDVGLLSADAVVFASDAPAMDRFMARAMKGVYGDRIQICDGTADQVEIQAAVDAGYSTRLSSGSFTDNEPITLDTDDIIYGTNRRATTISLANGADCNILQTADDNTHRYDITIRDMSLDGNKANTTAGNGIALYSVWYSTLTNLDIRNMSGAGIYYGDPGDAGQNAHIENVEICLCEGSGIDIAYGACTDGSIWNARCYSNGMVTGYNLQIACSNWQVYSLNASATPASKYNVRVDGSEFGVFFYGLIITDNATDANGLVFYASSSWNYGSRVIGGYISNEAAGTNTGYGIYARYGGTKQVQDLLIQGVRINGYGYAARLSGELVYRARITENIFQNQDSGILLDTGTGTRVWDNTGYLGSGESRTYAVPITAGSENTTTYWQNPFPQNVWITEARVQLTTADNTTDPVYDMAIDTDGSGLPDGAALFTDIPDTAATYWSWSNAYGGAESGVQTGYVQLASNAGTGDWVGLSITTAAGDYVVGTIYITIMGQ